MRIMKRGADCASLRRENRIGDDIDIPDLEILDRGDLVCSNIKFPPEMIPLNAWSPNLAQPIIAVHAGAMPYGTNRDGELILYPIRNVDRLIIPNGPVITPLPAPPAGLAAAGKRALCWYCIDTGMEFLVVCLEKAQVIEKFAIDGMVEAAARIINRDFFIWEKDTLRVFQEAN